MTPLVLFDIDLTLIHTSGAGRNAITAAFKRLWDLDEPTRGVSFDGRTDHAIFREVVELNALANGDIEAVLARVIDAYLEELPSSLAANNGRILPGVPALLDALAAASVPLGLATGNLRRGAAAKLGHFGLWDRFSAGGFGDESPIRADIVRRGIVDLATAAGRDPDPRRAIVVGDTPLDVEAAHLAGAIALAVAAGSYSLEQLVAAGADIVHPDLSDTARTLDLLLNR